jgi:hypothetical protein
MEKTIILIVNRNTVEEELILSDVLVTNREEPYYSLSCLRNKAKYNFESFCSPCPRFAKCTRIFVNGGYVIDTRKNIQSETIKFKTRYSIFLLWFL